MDVMPSSTAFWTMSSMLPPLGMDWMRCISGGLLEVEGVLFRRISTLSLASDVICPWAAFPSPSKTSMVSPSFDLRTRVQWWASSPVSAMCAGCHCAAGRK